MGRAERLLEFRNNSGLSRVESSTTKALVLPPPCASFYTLTSFSLVKKSFPPSIYQKHGHLICTPCTSTIEKGLPFSVPHVKKSQGKALIGPAWARCQAYTNESNECQAPHQWCGASRNSMSYVLEPHSSVRGRTRFKVDIISHIMCPMYTDNFYQVTYQTLAFV